MSGSALLDERTLLAQPSLVRAFGAVKALVVQQLHWHVLYDDGVEHEGHPWYPVTYTVFADELGMTADQVRRAIEGLEADGVVVSCQPEGWSSRRKWYRVDRDHASLQLARTPDGKRRRRQMPTGAYAKSPTTQTPKTPRLADGEDPAPRGARPRDEVWDALVDEFGAPETDTERKRFGKVVRELKAAGATGPQAKVRAHRARAAWPTCSVVAVSANWRLLGEGQPRRGSRPDAPEWDRGAEPGRVTL